MRDSIIYLSYPGGELHGRQLIWAQGRRAIRYCLLSDTLFEIKQRNNFFNQSNILILLSLPFMSVFK